MQGILSFDDGECHANKRRKAVKACNRCKDSKKRCILEPSARRCRRCTDDRQPCSFESLSLLSPVGQHVSEPLDTDQTRNTVPSSGSSRSNHWTHESSLSNRGHHGASISRFGVSPEEQAAPVLPSTTDYAATEFPTSETDTPASHDSKEFRYTTMLSMMDGKGSGARDPESRSHRQSTKLISGTNPLSALLRKELKHQIVTNSCSFRTPDPPTRDLKSFRRAGCGLHNCNWEQAYYATGVSEPRLQYLRAIGCFKLPPPARCSQLLEIFFTYIHPMLPVIDRKDFLARYYGNDEPPPLIILHAIFLAATRYLPSNQEELEAQGSVSETRLLCDNLHSKLRALFEFDIQSDRTAVVQASLIASLHWEGREGVNSAIDNLSLAVRTCQEMGLHRKMPEPLTEGIKSKEQIVSQLQRRLWWLAYTLDRFAAAQEGTPFLINEDDCDAEPLSEDDLSGEDHLTVKTAVISYALARLVEDAVRKLYRPGEDHTTLFSPRGLAIRDVLDMQLQQLSADIRTTLLADSKAEKALDDFSGDSRVLCGTLLLIHLDAVRILVQRPFLLYKDESGQYKSRELCRKFSTDILSRLNALLEHGMIRFSWPFTVYALVNSLLIFWYDISSPPFQRDTARHQDARGKYSSVVHLLKVMGSTWWAAAAKHKLAQALALAANELELRYKTNEAKEQQTETNHLDTSTGHVTGQHNYGSLLSPLSGMTDLPHVPNSAWPDPSIFTDCSQQDYWTSLDLDFDLDVACNIFHIDQLNDFN